MAWAGDRKGRPNDLRRTDASGTGLSRPALGEPMRWPNQKTGRDKRLVYAAQGTISGERAR
ncbi:MAG: hypothetical protein J4F38_10875 [Pseudomonadales bacterium]|nr:hypothetical protein [Pseudomonadales bacterium]